MPVTRQPKRGRKKARGSADPTADIDDLQVGGGTDELCELPRSVAVPDVEFVYRRQIVNREGIDLLADMPKRVKNRLAEPRTGVVAFDGWF